LKLPRATGRRRCVLIGTAALALTIAACCAESPLPANGTQLARKYCASCHLFPEPELLDKATWKNGALPLMRSRLGIGQIDPANPQQKPVLEEWAAICKYYIEAAPEKAIAQPPHEKIQMGLRQFEVMDPGYRPGKRYVTMLSVD